MEMVGLLARMVGVVGLGVGIAALVVLCDVVLPGVVARARDNVERRPVRSFIIGLINVAFFGVIAVALLAAKGGAGLLGATLATLVLGVVAVGLSAVARLVGERLRPGDPNGVRRLLAGAVTLELAALVPLVGWFLLPALAGLTGCGATILALRRRQPAPATPADAPGAAEVPSATA
jgi:hypothetical protein